MVSLPPSALWEVIRRLQPTELRTLWAEVSGTRLEWLLRTLRKMSSYKEDSLVEAYKQAHPGKDIRLLRVYKRQLWDLLEEILPMRCSSYLQKEIRLWRRIWLSVWLWQRGMDELAETLWYQCLSQASQMGWYETALWLLSLGELYERDFYIFNQSESIASWTEELLSKLSRRYYALSRKIVSLEKYRLSSHKKTYMLPNFPPEGWNEYLNHYAQLITLARGRNFPEALHILLKMIQTLLRGVDFPESYASFHLAVSLSNLGILLVNLQLWETYEQWYRLWEVSRVIKYWPLTAPYLRLYAAVQAIRLSALIRQALWKEAYEQYCLHKNLLEELIFLSHETLAFRANRATGIYTVLLLASEKSRAEAAEWGAKVEDWMDREGYREMGWLWVNFLRWYEAFREKNRTWMRNRYRKLWQAYQRYFAEHVRWGPILKLCWSLTEGLSSTQRRWARRILARWEAYPAEKYRWEVDSLIFPMPLFVKSILNQSPLEILRPSSEPTKLPPALLEALHDTLSLWRHRMGGDR